MNPFVQQPVYIVDREPITVSASPTSCPYLVITPAVTRNEDGGIDFGLGVSLTHTLTGRSVVSGTSAADLRKLAAQLAEFDWAFTDAEWFASPANASVRAAISEKIRDWRKADAYSGPLPALPGDTEQTKADMERAPAATFLRDHIAWWLKHGKQCIWGKAPQVSVKDDKAAWEMWTAHVGTSSESYGLIYLLAVLLKVAPDVADIAARELVVDYDAGDGMGEWVYQWGEELAAGKPLTLTGIPDANPLAGFTSV